MHDTAPAVDPRLHDITRHIKPGRQRAPFFRYIRFNLPRLTRALLFVVVALQGALAVAVSRTDFHIFDGQRAALWLLAGCSGIFAVLCACTRWRIWDFGLVPALGSVALFIGGIAGTAPWVPNGAHVYLAAGWNTMFFCGLAYLLLYWALDYGVLVAYPETQGFED